jgi:SAM-dependent methyltransferase
MKTFVPLRLRELPQVAEHNWLIHDCMLRFLSSAATHANGVLVDIGCGNKPWRTLFADHVRTHIGVDLPTSHHSMQWADVKGTAYATSLNDNQANTVLCTEVLEHLERPEDAIAEMYRILSPGGVVILTVPLFWPIHEAPRDFFRYTHFGLKHLFEAAGFDIVEIRPLTGFIITSAQMLTYFNLRILRGRLLRTLARPVNWAIQHAAIFLGRYDNSTEFTCIYGLVARKPSL